MSSAIIDRAKAGIRAVRAGSEERPATNYDNLAAMTQTLLIVSAIEKLTEAVNENTKAVRWLGPRVKEVEPD